ncbi:NEDD8-activating protein uba3, partial [Cotesia glomerata]
LTLTAAGVICEKSFLRDSLGPFAGPISSRRLTLTGIPHGELQGPGQFLFRHKDLGSSKAEVAAKFINERVPGCSVTPHCCKIQDKDESFYRQFHIVVRGLDSIVARRWINGMIISLLNYEDNELDHSSVIPLVDGGTERVQRQC